MKLLKLKKTAPQQNEWSRNPGSRYLAGLARLLKNDIADLAVTQSTEDWVRLSRVMKVFLGNLDEKIDPEQGGYNYLFLNVPSTRGFMIEMTAKGDALELRRGTLIVPIKRNVFEELEQSNLYVTSPRLIERYEIVSSDIVRTHEPIKTYTLEVMTEWLLSLAFGLEEPVEQEQDYAKLSS